MAVQLPQQVTVDWLKEVYLSGIDLCDQNGKPMTDEALKYHLRSAISRVETRTGLSMFPVTITGEKHDLDQNSNGEFYQTMLRVKPVRALTGLRLRYGNHEASYAAPVDWLIERNLNVGEVEIIINRATAAFQMATGFPFILGPGMQGFNRMASWMRWDYDAGFDAGEVPYEALEAIGALAAIIPLSIQNTRLLGSPGLRGGSISHRGLSQSFSAGDGYGALIREYKEIADRAIETLRGNYRSIPLAVW